MSDIRYSGIQLFPSKPLHWHEPSFFRKIQCSWVCSTGKAWRSPETKVSPACAVSMEENSGSSTRKLLVALFPGIFADSMQLSTLILSLLLNRATLCKSLRQAMAGMFTPKNRPQWLRSATPLILSQRPRAAMPPAFQLGGRIIFKWGCCQLNVCWTQKYWNGCKDLPCWLCCMEGTSRLSTAANRPDC